MLRRPCLRRRVLRRRLAAPPLVAAGGSANAFSAKFCADIVSKVGVLYIICGDDGVESMNAVFSIEGVALFCTTGNTIFGL